MKFGIGLGVTGFDYIKNFRILNMLEHINIFWIIAIIILMLILLWFVNYKTYYEPTKNRLISDKNMSRRKASVLAFLYTLMPFLI
ncbi:hypothetical protein JK159_02070 [Weissella minor]|uniref:hypothetical protein n=1 Tax=Weissella minor TaxID=1620 RepID=UPI001BAFE0CD|nr:hypothetical protein [Weissella minor]MBS0949169.1 hypothetical protein [Weissella minor]